MVLGFVTAFGIEFDPLATAAAAAAAATAKTTTAKSAIASTLHLQK